MSKVLKQLPNFQNHLLLQQALTHSSYANEHPEVQKDNERLEFLGDAVLNFLSGEFLYKRYPQKTEGELTPLRSVLVDARQLAEFAVMLNLGHQLRLGRGAEQDGGRNNLRMLSSVFEAVIGAYFLDSDSNINAVRSYVVPFFDLVISRLAELQDVGTIQAKLDSSHQPSKKMLIQHESAVNYKSRFQEWAQANHRENPTYAIAHESGPDHAKTFITEVFVNNKFYGRGTGRKKQDAEKDAARDALDRLNLL